MMIGGEETENMLASLARTIIGRIHASADPPGIMHALPAANRIPDTERYLNHYLQLNNLFYLSEEDILQFKSGAEGAYAEYRLNGSPSTKLVILQYASDTQAEKVLKTVEAFLNNDASSRTDKEKGICLFEKNNGSWFGIFLYEQFLVINLENSSQNHAVELMQSAMQHISAQRKPV
jgi:hypothetical protein